MTLILSITTRQASVHASDRRVTLAGATPSIYSPLENKTIIFLARDAVGTIGFTGLAFVGKQPTDQWIANNLAPQPAGSPPLGSFAFGGLGLGRAKLRTIIWRLKGAMSELPWHLRRYGLTIQLAGYRTRRRRSVPFCVEIEWKGGAPKIDGWMRSPRTRQQETIFGQIGDGWPVTKMSKAVADYAAAGGHEGMEAIRIAAIAAIRERSTEAMAVGSDLMTVVVPNPVISREIVWRFEPSSPHPGAIVSSSTSRKFQAIYSPWVITPGSVSCPCVGTGGANLRFGGFQVKCGNDRTMSGPGILFATSNQQRILPPRQKPR